MKTLRFLFLLSLFGYFVACAPAAEDENPPTVNIDIDAYKFTEDTICGNFLDSLIILEDYERISLSLRMQDDVELSRLHVDLLPAANCKPYSYKANSWEVSDIIQIQDDLYSLTYFLQVPENVYSGLYELHVQVRDQSGKTSPYRSIYFYLVNQLDQTDPRIVLDSSMQQSYSLTQGDTLSVAFMIEDNNDLGSEGKGGYYAVLENENGTIRIVSEGAFKEGNGQFFTYNEPYIIPANMPKGVWILRIGAWDGVKNRAELVEIPIEVKEP